MKKVAATENTKTTIKIFCVLFIVAFLIYSYTPRNIERTLPAIALDDSGNYMGTTTLILDGKWTPQYLSRYAKLKGKLSIENLDFTAEDKVEEQSFSLTKENDRFSSATSYLSNINANISGFCLFYSDKEFKNFAVHIEGVKEDVSCWIIASANTVEDAYKIYNSLECPFALISKSQ